MSQLHVEDGTTGLIVCSVWSSLALASLLLAIFIIYFWNGNFYLYGLPLAHIFECLVHSWWNCLERMRRCGLVGRGMSLAASLEVSQIDAILVSSLSDLWLLSQHVSSQLLLSHHAGLSAAMLLIMMVKDSSFATVNPINHIKLYWPWCLSTAIEKLQAQR